jgi:hypothetical protein
MKKRETATSPRPSPPGAEREKTGGRGTPKPIPIIVTDLRAIEAAHREAVLVDVFLGGRCFRFEGRRLIPSEANRVKQLLQLALPPMIPPAKEGEEPRYDFENADYAERHERCRRNGRALALWLGYPCFKAEAERLLGESREQKEESKKEAAGAPEVAHFTGRVPERVPETVEEIAAFIESRALEDDAVQGLYLALMERPVEVQAYVNFTSGSGFQKS